MPFAGYTDFAECVRQNQQARDPDAYCGSIKHKTEDKMQKAIDSASYLHQAVRAAVTLVAKGHDPVQEMGKKKLTAKEGAAAEGAQDDQAFAVAFGPDNYDKLVKQITAAPYRDAYRAAGTILKALENKQFNFPGNLEEHLKKAHAAIHGREMWDERYGDVCKLITQARKVLHSIEKTAEAPGEPQGGGAPPMMGKADPATPKKPSAEQRYTSQFKPRGAQPSYPFRGGKTPPHAKLARKAAGGYRFPKGSPPRDPKPRVGRGNLPPSGFAHRGTAYKAVDPSAAMRNRPRPKPAKLGEPAGPRSLAGEKTRGFSREQFKPGFVREAVQKAIQAVQGR